MKRLLSGLAMLALTGPAVSEEGLDDLFAKDVLIVEASDYGCFKFDVYVAVTDAQRSRGLMYVREMPATTGMLFIYPGDYVLSMWMKNTFISLDMVFARADGTVINVIRNTEPQSLQSLRSTEVAAFVLELNAGVTERLTIDENSRIHWEPAHGNDE